MSSNPEQPGATLRSIAEKKVGTLFSSKPRSVKDVLQAANELKDSPGIKSFMLAVPWEIRLPDGTVTTSLSENMVRAVDDIIHYLEKISPDTLITLDIDPRQLNQTEPSRG